MNFIEDINNALARVRRDVVDSYKEFTGQAAAERAAYEAEQAMLAEALRLQNEQGYMDKFMAAVRNAANTGFENGQLVAAGFTGLTKQMVDRYTAAVQETCGENYACNQAAAYLPQLLALIALASVAAVLARTDVAKKAVNALVENLNAISGNLPTFTKPASTVTIEQLSDSEDEEVKSQASEEVEEEKAEEPTPVVTPVVVPAAPVVAPAVPNLLAVPGFMTELAARAKAVANKLAAPVAAPAPVVAAPAPAPVLVVAPVVAPAAPVVAPAAPVVAPAAPVVVPAAPVVAPAAPVVAPKAPDAAPAEPNYARMFYGRG